MLIVLRIISNDINDDNIMSIRGILILQAQILQAYKNIHYKQTDDKTNSNNSRNTTDE